MTDVVGMTMWQIAIAFIFIIPSLSPLGLQTYYAVAKLRLETLELQTRFGI